MDDAEVKKQKYVQAGGKLFPAKPGFTDYVKEGFESTDTRAQLDAIRRRKEKLENSNG